MSRIKYFLVLLTALLWTAADAAPPRPSLIVSPSTDVTITGDVGGPFTPATFSYSLSTAKKWADFAISGTPGWLAASQNTGRTPVVVNFTVNASGLAAGTYVATISFTNVTNGFGNTTRTATITVVAPPVPPDPTPPPQSGGYLLCDVAPIICTDDAGNLLTAD